LPQRIDVQIISVLDVTNRRRGCKKRRKRKKKNLPAIP